MEGGRKGGTNGGREGLSIKSLNPSPPFAVLFYAFELVS